MIDFPIVRVLLGTVGGRKKWGGHLPGREGELRGV